MIELELKWQEPLSTKIIFYLALPIPVSQQFKNFAPPEIYIIRPLPPTSSRHFYCFPSPPPSLPQ